MHRSIRTVVSFPLVLLAAFVAGCGSDDDSANDDVARSKTPSAEQRAEASQDRLAGSAASADAGAGSNTAAGAATSSLGDCLVAAGFASGPPGHGIVAQWSHSDGTVVAQSTDPAQAQTQAAEFAGGAGTPVVVGDGVIIAGSGSTADAARTCATA